MTEAKQTIWLPHVVLTYFHAALVLLNLWTASSMYESNVPMLIGLMPGMSIGMSLTLVLFMWDKNKETFIDDIKQPFKLRINKRGNNNA
ncbi:hypothetical protein VPFG_00287 [Vibrio phage nt-1]|uniref:Uncharacterized protein n=1 Tax=Vibrio phage nt-1 TaxID=115992 RepID=R9TES1_9CAUD|nr:hypothetical protein VPFG_00287 [Vibrio phage nt-1]AGN30286.1 hypothetical protein VPFG_00287 [Vibrio phage nt-1]